VAEGEAEDDEDRLDEHERPEHPPHDGGVEAARLGERRTDLTRPAEALLARGGRRGVLAGHDGRS
jgi:hypothetical protein